jgi:PAS domain S-box-containing protein
VTSRLRILLLEDDPRDAELVQELLSDEFEFEITYTQREAEFAEALESTRFDLILADYRLPSFDGLSALELALSLRPDVPFIFVSGTIGEDVAIEALKRGATDYVLKTRLSRLVPSVQRALREAKDRAERQAAQEALRRSDAYLAEAQRLSNTGAFAFNATDILYWSEGSYRIWGFDPQQPLPSHEVWWERVHPDDRAQARDELEEALRQRRDYALEYRIILPDGTMKHVRTIGHPSYSAGGELVEVIGTTIDVTERKRAQEEREQLRQLEAELAHLNRLSIMSELTASLAHEILHPIAAARNNARSGMLFLQMSPPNLGEVVEALACVVRDADRAKDIVARIRDHIRKAPPREERFDINDAIKAVIVMMRNTIDTTRIAIRTSLTEQMPSVWGDPVQLQQVVLNLILNAVEAMSAHKEGPRELSITTGQSDADNVLVEVCDSGPGMTPEQLNQIFDAFYTTKASGLGLGLSICRSIINAHGGRLWAETNQPRGAVFRFSLPVAQARASAAISS